ncbi:bifunctional diaminohydroxyphosphoribosylaminopyrimidine deaminase/5-amino-6-(5-phosphoribosylamino)uracil reductase RibD [bacterium]|nr:bifunctional diaminohydroxyphosphoribosylaminopyrimidine deaminase/5-amino-6-(5-phosphoribosylamino)uracil reductase RibD [bacterium]
MYDDFYMERCLELAALGRGLVSPNPLVGAVIVRDNKIIAEGYHEKFGGPHAEINALRKLNFDARGATLYVNLEPCFHFGKTPPCVDAVINSGVKRVVIGMADPNTKTHHKSIRKLKKNGIQVTVGVLQDKCAFLNRFFTTFITKKRPHVILKAAVTLNFKMAPFNSQKIWLTGHEAVCDVHALRSTVDAVLVGAGTVIADDPQLNVRYGSDLIQPTRVILQGKRSLSPQSRIFTTPGGEVLTYSSKNLKSVLDDLGQKGKMSVLVEGGPTVMKSFLKEKLVDEVLYYVAPTMLEKKDKSFVEPYRLLKELPALKLNDVQILGGDLRLHYSRNLL